MKIEEVIGGRVAEVRSAAGMSQDALGKQLEGLLGRAWSRQSVSAAEKGGRAFTAAELVALAPVLGVPVIALLTPPFEVRELELPTGQRIEYREASPGPGVSSAVLESLRRLEENAARRATIDQQERDLVDRLIARLADEDGEQR